jgi:hypothetical protein
MSLAVERHPFEYASIDLPLPVVHRAVSQLLWSSHFPSRTTLSLAVSLCCRVFSLRSLGLTNYSHLVQGEPLALLRNVEFMMDHIRQMQCLSPPRLADHLPAGASACLFQRVRGTAASCTAPAANVPRWMGAKSGAGAITLLDSGLQLRPLECSKVEGKAA